MVPRRLITLIMIPCLISSQAFAQALSSDMTDDTYRSKVAEYFYSRSGTEVLKPVKLLGMVNKQGIFQVPKDTSLVTLLSIAGGTQKDADLKEITVTSPSGKLTKFNFESGIRTGADLSLGSNDIIFVPEKQYYFDQPTSRAVGVVTGVLSFLLTVYLVSKVD